MSWVKIDDGFFRHPKAIAAGMTGRELYLAGICFCSSGLTDGFLPENAIRLLAAETGVQRPFSVAETLVRVGLWEAVEGGFQIHNYLRYNQSSRRVQAERDAAAERMRRRRSGEQMPHVPDEFAESSGNVRANNGRTSDEQIPNFGRSSLVEEKRREKEQNSLSPPVGVREEEPMLERSKRQSDVFKAYAAAAGIEPGTHEYHRHYNDAMSTLAGVDDHGTMPPPDVMALMTGFVIATWAKGGITTTPKIGKVLEHETEFRRWHTAWVEAASPTINGVPEYMLLRRSVATANGSRTPVPIRDNVITSDEFEPF